MRAPLAPQFSLTFGGRVTKLSAYLRVLFEVMLLCADPSGDQVILHAVSQREIVVAGSGDVAILDEGEVEMAIEALLHLADILDLGDSANGDLFALVVVALRRGHG